MNINFGYNTWNLDNLGIHFLLIVDKRMLSQIKRHFKDSFSLELFFDQVRISTLFMKYKFLSADNCLNSSLASPETKPFEAEILMHFLFSPEGTQHGIWGKLWI